MSKNNEIDLEVVNAVLTIDPKELEPQTKTEFKDAEGKVIAEGNPAVAVADIGSDWVARVSSMSLSIKVTPKIGNDFMSVERSITVDVNTLDKNIVQGIWKSLQEQVVAGVFNTLSLTLKQLNEAKKGM